MTLNVSDFCYYLLAEILKTIHNQESSFFPPYHDLQVWLVLIISAKSLSQHSTFYACMSMSQRLGTLREEMAEIKI